MTRAGFLTRIVAALGVGAVATTASATEMADLEGTSVVPSSPPAPPCELCQGTLKATGPWGLCPCPECDPCPLCGGDKFIRGSGPYADPVVCPNYPHTRHLDYEWGEPPAPPCPRCNDRREIPVVGSAGDMGITFRAEGSYLPEPTMPVWESRPCPLCRPTSEDIYTSPVA